MPFKNVILTTCNVCALRGVTESLEGLFKMFFEQDVPFSFIMQILIIFKEICFLLRIISTHLLKEIKENEMVSISFPEHVQLVLWNESM